MNTLSCPRLPCIIKPQLSLTAIANNYQKRRKCSRAFYRLKTSASLLQTSSSAKMASNNHNDNPWEDQRSQQGQSYPNHNLYQGYQEEPQTAYSQQPPQHQQHETSPWSQEPHAQTHSPYAQSQPQQNSQSSYQQQPPAQSDYSERDEAPPGLPPRRTATDIALPTGQDRSHQIEVMQSYEAAGRKDEDDANVEVLQREFPKIDGSLIAAIYGDSKSLSATREMLQALE